MEDITAAITAHQVVIVAGATGSGKTTQLPKVLLSMGRGRPLPQAGAEERSVTPQAAASTEPMKEKTPRGDWAELLRRTLALDVFACARCGGRRKVLADVKGGGGVRAMLEHLGLAPAGARLAPARGPPQSAWC
ncbi:ATP-dependent helicase HrpA [Cystobacter fuscus DSM 2262]|uniref:ATP-dependent helicase HrpA n=1 Tax=Cystobacter fuscus (strain ATCC 25194 / DSM 2262 / NBRC 100088 / M29) TaxID=1242864 RepID=S9PI86_CYSF2|nr:ATP-dependent helicase HrpA [Cystobacter fuscus DSM 2262]